MPSPEQLSRLARQTGYRAETLEKVLRLLALLAEVHRHPFLSRVLILKGGTALNLGFGKPRRLSVDLDFNYIGALEREEMERDRPRVEEALGRIVAAQGYRTQWSRAAHAGRKCFLSYTSARGALDRIEVDLNFLHRLPLLEPLERELWSPEGGEPLRVRLLSLEELYAGKACAMLDRMAPRDLFDMATLPENAPDLPSSSTFRKVFIAVSGSLPHPVHSYGRARTRPVEANLIREQLHPMLLEGEAPDPEVLVERAWKIMEPLLRLTEAEKAFVDRLQVGELKPELLFPDQPDLAERVGRHPGLLWKAENAAGHAKGRRRKRQR
ncbi:MAG: nucleotidyl transferase AbiEii/AbiGii toxin family protein [Candidatus Latescibacteria bacterium]|nr:nucleotidyl transferase AbiEii/AbiGii toxin family protein [Candidatus Latescibacterota bacterium]